MHLRSYSPSRFPTRSVSSVFEPPFLEKKATLRPLPEPRFRHTRTDEGSWQVPARVPPSSGGKADPERETLSGSNIELTPGAMGFRRKKAASH